ncbi:MAG TPA: ABC transporter ATP-binding protein [Xanthobacteraceae bacterium]|nr:ABC transporter ATP-binding protein [Xanthobacteraceae bacterium]
MLRFPDPASLADRYAALTLLRRLLADYGRLYWRRYALALVFMAIAAGCTALSAYLIGEVVNQAYLHRDYRAIVILAGVVAAIFVAKGVSSYAQAVILARIANRIVADNQRRLFAKLLHESIGFFADRHSSEFMARLNAGAAAVGQVLNLLISAFGRDLLSLIGLLLVMAYQDPLMSLVSLLVAPPALFFLRKLIRRARTVAYGQFVGSARILETLQETIQGIRVVKAFTLEEEVRRRANAHIEEVEEASNKIARVANRSGPLMETLGGVAIAIVLLYAGYRIVNTGAAPGAFVSFLTAFLLAYEPAKRLARLNIDLNTGLVGVRVLFEVLDSASSEPAEDNRPPLALANARVELREVDFAYRKDEPVLHRLSFVAEPGRVTALVGPSGGGKSTVLALILRFHEPDRGEILIDGQNIAAVSRASLRRQLAYVGQDVFLFRGSIRDNIAFGRSGATEDAIIAAARAAFAHDFIMNFPRGYDTPVGEHGLQLSGGQRQRIAVARALLKDAAIILLDEATAALDSESEQQVQHAIARLCEGRTTIMVAHRLSTIVHADCIHVIEDGRVVETGRHHELLGKGGRYAAFYRLQLHEQGRVTAVAARA